MTIYEIFLAQPTACHTCRPYDRRIYKKGEGPHPPLHPHCHCRRHLHHVQIDPPTILQKVNNEHH